MLSNNPGRLVSLVTSGPIGTTLLKTMKTPVTILKAGDNLLESEVEQKIKEATA